MTWSKYDTRRGYRLLLTVSCSRFSTYESRFGLQTVNRATQERAYKRSFFDFVDFMKARLPEHK